MPQLDFSIWMINLITCWLMFFLVYSSTNTVLDNKNNINSSLINNNETNSNNWPW